jgi:DNA invertase Pin-like site-specific DNA recombinase
MSRALSLAGFQVTLIGRIWVTPEGLRNARAKGKMLGRPQLKLDRARIAHLHDEGRSLRKIASELGCSHALVHKTLVDSRLTRVEKSKT